MKELPHMPSSHVASYFHLVFSTKDRRRLILPEWEERLYSYMGGIINGMEAIPLKIGGIEDHVHSLVRLKSKHRLDYFLRDLKADSSEFVHKEITKMFEWQKGYGAFSVSPTAVEDVRRYIENQREHHRREDFKTEYVALLTKAGVEFEERFLW
jgi:putative transposase